MSLIFSPLPLIDITISKIVFAKAMSKATLESPIVFAAIVVLFGFGAELVELDLLVLEGEDVAFVLVGGLGLFFYVLGDFEDLLGGFHEVLSLEGYWLFV